MENNSKRTPAQFIGVLLLLLFCSNMVCAQSTYHYQKGKDYEKYNNRDRAFQEYKAGMQAGEVESAFETMMCYMNDYGTPRDTNAAKRILESWAAKNADMCFVALWIYSDMYNYYDYRNMIPYIKSINNWWAPQKIFDTKLSDIGGEWIAPNPQKALKYAKMYAKTDGGSRGKYEAENLLKVLESEYYFYGLAGLPKDRLKALEIGDEAPEEFSNIKSKLSTIILEAQKVEDLIPYVKYIEKYYCPFTDYDNSNRYSYWWGYYKKYNELYDEWCSRHKDNIKQAYAKESKEVQYLIYNFFNGLDCGYGRLLKRSDAFKTQKEIDSVVADAYRRSPVDDTALMRETWSRLSIYRLLAEEYTTKKSIPWSSFEALFSDNRYVELDGDWTYYNYKPNGAQNVPTRKIELIKHRQYCQKQKNENIEGTIYYLERDRYNENKWREVIKDIDDAVKIYPYSETASQLECAHKYVQAKIAQQNKTETVEMFIELRNCDSERYSSYAEANLKKYKAKRESIEQVLLQQQFEKENKKVYDAFRKTSIKGDLKKLTPEVVTEVKTVVLNPAIARCKEAIAVCPIDTTSKALQYYQGELSLCSLIEKANGNALTNDEIEKHLKLYGAGDYSELFVALRQKATEIANDKYALKRANELTAQSTKEEINAVKNLPMTKECAKEVKKLTSSSYLKSK